MSAKPRASRIVAVVAMALAALVLFVALWPMGKREAPPAGFLPLRDDALAARWCPILESEPAFGRPLAIYYRISRDGEGRTRIAYHPAWAREANRGPGWGPFLSRALYTGGLSLQRAMFGRGDIETIGLDISPQGRLLEVEYERARDYDPAAFSVTHEKVLDKGPFTLPLRLKVMSWNHLFAREAEASPAPALEIWAAGDAAPAGARPLPLAYFSSELWASYAMWKNPETLLRKDRAHFPWERAAAD